MGSVDLTLRLDLENLSSDIVYSASIVKDHIIYALKILFGEIGAALPFQVTSVDSGTREIHIIIDKIYLQKFRSALTLQDQYQGVSCCFTTLKVQQ